MDTSPFCNSCCAVVATAADGDSDGEECRRVFASYLSSDLFVLLPAAAADDVCPTSFRKPPFSDRMPPKLVVDKK